MLQLTSGLWGKLATPLLQSNQYIQMTQTLNNSLQSFQELTVDLTTRAGQAIDSIAGTQTVRQLVGRVGTSINEAQDAVVDAAMAYAENMEPSLQVAAVQGADDTVRMWRQAQSGITLLSPAEEAEFGTTMADTPLTGGGTRMPRQVLDELLDAAEAEADEAWAAEPGQQAWTRFARMAAEESRAADAAWPAQRALQLQTLERESIAPLQRLIVKEPNVEGAIRRMTRRVNGVFSRVFKRQASSAIEEADPLLEDWRSLYSGVSGLDELEAPLLELGRAGDVQLAAMRGTASLADVDDSIQAIESVYRTANVPSWSLPEYTPPALPEAAGEVVVEPVAVDEAVVDLGEVLVDLGTLEDVPNVLLTAPQTSLLEAEAVVSGVSSAAELAEADIVVGAAELAGAEAVAGALGGEAIEDVVGVGAGIAEAEGVGAGVAEGIGLAGMAAGAATVATGAGVALMGAMQLGQVIAEEQNAVRNSNREQERLQAIADAHARQEGDWHQAWVSAHASWLAYSIGISERRNMTRAGRRYVVMDPSAGLFRVVTAMSYHFAQTKWSVATEGHWNDLRWNIGGGLIPHVELPAGLTEWNPVVWPPANQYWQVRYQSSAGVFSDMIIRRARSFHPAPLTRGQIAWNRRTLARQRANLNQNLLSQVVATTNRGMLMAMARHTANDQEEKQMGDDEGVMRVRWYLAMHRDPLHWLDAYGDLTNPLRTKPRALVSRWVRLATHLNEEGARETPYDAFLPGDTVNVISRVMPDGHLSMGIRAVVQHIDRNSGELILRSSTERGVNHGVVDFRRDPHDGGLTQHFHNPSIASMAEHAASIVHPEEHAEYIPPAWIPPAAPIVVPSAGAVVLPATLPGYRTIDQSQLDGWVYNLKSITEPVLANDQMLDMLQQMGPFIPNQIMLAFRRATARILAESHNDEPHTENQAPVTEAPVITPAAPQTGGDVPKAPVVAAPVVAAWRPPQVPSTPAAPVQTIPRRRRLPQRDESNPVEDWNFKDIHEYYSKPYADSHSQTRRWPKKLARLIAHSPIGRTPADAAQNSYEYLKDIGSQAFDMIRDTSYGTLTNQNIRQWLKNLHDFNAVVAHLIDMSVSYSNVLNFGEQREMQEFMVRRLTDTFYDDVVLFYEDTGMQTVEEQVELTKNQLWDAGGRFLEDQAQFPYDLTRVLTMLAELYEDGFRNENHPELAGDTVEHLGEEVIEAGKKEDDESKPTNVFLIVLGMLALVALFLSL